MLLSNSCFCTTEYVRPYLYFSICDIIVIPQSSNVDGKLHFFGQDYILLALFAQKYKNSNFLFTDRKLSCFVMANKRGEHSLVNVFERYEGTKCQS